jgi:hypothetical protein
MPIDPQVRKQMLADIHEVCESFLFELNTENTRATIKARILEYAHKYNIQLDFDLCLGKDGYNIGIVPNDKFTTDFFNGE